MNLTQEKVEPIPNQHLILNSKHDIHYIYSLRHCYVIQQVQNDQ